MTTKGTLNRNRYALFNTKQFNVQARKKIPRDATVITDGISLQLRGVFVCRCTNGSFEKFLAGGSLQQCDIDACWQTIKESTVTGIYLQDICACVRSSLIGTSLVLRFHLHI